MAANILRVLEAGKDSMQQHHWVDRLDAGIDACDTADVCEVLHGLIDRLEALPGLLAAAEALLARFPPVDHGTYVVDAAWLDDLRAAVAAARGN